MDDQRDYAEEAANQRVLDGGEDGDEDGPAEFTDPPRYPAGTPEYDAYAVELRAELGKFARREPPYDARDF